MFRSPLFGWSPRPDQDLEASPASQSPSRFGAFHNNIRTMINGSSVYSQSPALSNNNTPKMPFLGFLQRQQSPDPNVLPVSNDASRQPNDLVSPLRAQHTAGSYIRTIAPLQEPQEPQTIYSRHPADVSLPHQQDRYVDPEIQELAAEINGRRRRRRKHRHRRRKHERTDQWVRRRDEGSTVTVYVRGTAARGKTIACIISGTFLVTVLAIYLAVALTNHDLGQEIHILFIMVLLIITIFFCHSLIRLCMLMLNPPRQEHRPHIPSMTGPDGFQPIVPIRVHLARDEEASLPDEVVENDMDIEDPEKHIPPPPPAYGLWRSSVRADPNLLHWRRIEDQRASVTDVTSPRNGFDSGPVSPSGPAPLPALTGDRASNLPALAGPRPPSYASEDGVSYIIEAAPRSTVNRQSHTGVSDIHPAWRPGYAMSEIRGDEWGRRL